MPRLRNAKHEIVAQELAAGKTAVQASRIAEFPAGSSFVSNAKRRAQRKDIRARVLEIKEMVAGRSVAGVVVTLEKLVCDSQRALEKAENDEKGAAGAAAMVSAITCQAKLTGFWVEKNASTDPTGTQSVAPFVVEIVRFSDAKSEAAA